MTRSSDHSHSRIMGDSQASGAEQGVRGSLVTSLAANIFDNLKSNDDIATILTGVLDPARSDKVVNTTI